MSESALHFCGNFILSSISYFFLIQQYSLKLSKEKLESVYRTRMEARPSSLLIKQDTLYNFYCQMCSFLFRIVGFYSYKDKSGTVTLPQWSPGSTMENHSFGMRWDARCWQPSLSPCRLILYKDKIWLPEQMINAIKKKFNLGGEWWETTVPVGQQPCINLWIIMKFRESLLIIHMFPHKKDCYHWESGLPSQPGRARRHKLWLIFRFPGLFTKQSPDSWALGITIIANVSMLLLGSMTWKQWKKAKNTNPANQDK